MAFRLSCGFPTCVGPYAAFSTRSYSRSFETSLRRARFLSLHRREFHSSLSLLKKKQKGKAAIDDQDDQFGLQAQDGGDLFGELAAESTKTTKAAPRISPTHEEVEKTEIRRTAAYSSEKTVQFEDVLSRLENRVGKPPPPPTKFIKAVPPPEFGLLATLLALVQTPEDYERFMQVLAQWRKYPRRLGSQFMEHVISRGINVGAAPQALDILLHQPKFGISLRRATVARQLMHALCVPPPSPPIPPEKQEHIPYTERVKQALQLATLLPHANLVEVTRDLTSSALLLSLMCRASDPSLTKQSLEPSLGGEPSDEPERAQPTQANQEPDTQWKDPIQELLSGLRQSQKSNTLVFPQHRNERVWTLNSLRVAEPLLRKWEMKDVKWLEWKARKIERSLATPGLAQQSAVAE